MKRVLATIVIAFTLFLFSGTVFGNIVPPSPTNSFYGDANGDMIIAAADIAQMNKWMLGFPYIYDTVQPQFPTQDWNTSDVTSDALIAASDIAVINKWMLGFPVAVQDKPWALSNENLPLINNIAGNTIPFQVNLASIDLALNTWGRAGLPVIAQIDAPNSTITGSLVGRTCAPVGGSRDQSTLLGDQCALSVSVTDWYGAPGFTKGLTETGTYGLSVIGNGTGNLRIVFSINSFPPGLDIPAITHGIVVGFIGGSINNPPVWNTAPTNISGVAIGSTYGPTVDGIASDPDAGETLTCSSNGTSCTFPVTVSGSSTTPTPVSCSVGFTADLTAQTCNLRVVVTDDGIGALSVGSTISITTVNNGPTWATAPTPINVSVGGTFNATDGTATDLDTGETLTCSSNGTSCVGFVPAVTGSGAKPLNCNVNLTATNLVQACAVRIMVADNGVPAATLGATVAINVTNAKPTWSTAPSNITAVPLGSTRAPTVDGIATDADVPAQVLACSSGGTSCTFTPTVTGSSVAPTSCLVGFTANLTAQTCNLRIVVTDTASPAGTLGATISITTVNNGPTWATAPTNISASWGQVYSATDGTATDADTGETLTCSSNGTSCVGFPVGPTVSGSGPKPQNCNVAFTAPLANQICNLRIMVADNGSPAATIGSTIQISVTGNASPVFTTTGGTTARQGLLYSYTAGTSDPDVGQILTCTLGTNTCGGVLPADTPGLSPHNCPAYTFTPGPGAQTCQFRLVVADNYAPAATAGQTTTVTINRAPTWSTPPSAITRNIGVAQNGTDGIATDVDVPAQVLTCSSNGTSCGFAPVVTGSSVAPTSCNVAFPAQNTATVCNLRIMVTDAGSPAATLGSTISITIVQNPPTFTTTGGTTAGQGVLYSYTAGTTDLDTGENLTCTLGTNTCVGTLPADTPGLKPHNCPAYTFTPGAGLQTCQFRIVVTDNGSPAATAGQTTTVTINRAPTWSTPPSAITRNIGVAQNGTDGIATDVDVPAQVLTCSSNGTSCGFAPVVTGSSVAPTSCNVAFPAQNTATVCNLRIMVTDAGSPAATLGSTISITIVQNPPTFTTTGGTTAGQGVLYSYTAGTTDLDTGENLTCTLGTNTCVGTLPVDIPGVKPHNCPAYTFTPGAGAQSCQFRLVVTDNGTPAATAGQTTTVIINRNPTWSTPPTNITQNIGVLQNGPDGIATDIDVPAQVLTCSSNGTSCGFVPVVSGSSTSPTTCNVAFPAQNTATVCNLRIMVTDAGTPAATLGSTISITIVQNPPTFTTTGPTTARQGLAYTYAAGTTDLDTAELLTCTLGTNTCVGSLPADTPGVKPHTCSTYTFTPGAGLQTCQFRIIVTDNGSPAATAGQTTTVTINRAPTWSTPPSNITQNIGVLQNGPDGIATDIDVPAQVLTCSSNGTSCGFVPVVSGSSLAPTTCNVAFPAQNTATVCNLRIMVTDAGSPAATLGSTISITIVQNAPTWTTAPTDITLCPGSPYNQNSIATDADTSETLTCSNSGALCSAAVSGASTKPVTCNLSGNMGIANCNMRLMVADSGVPSATLGQTVQLIARTVGCIVGPTWNTVATQTAVAAFDNAATSTTLIERIRVNYPANWNRVVLNFSGAITACAGTVNCGGTVQTVTPTVSGSSCILTVTSGGGIWTENRDCAISAVTSTPACSNCTGLTSTYHTSLAMANCATRGGTCGGFIDDGTYGTGNTLDVRVVDWRAGTLFCAEAAVCGTATNLNHTYVLVEQPNQTPLVRIEKFDANDDGIVAVTGLLGDLMKSDVVKVTAAYKGMTGMCENSFGEAGKCYQFSTFDNVDSRRILVPMEFTNSADWQLPEAQLWGYVPIAGFSKYVGPRMANLDRFPNPLRAGFVVLSLLDQSMSSINLEDLLRSTGDDSTLSLCFGGLGANIGGLSLPGNLMIPDLIRQQWNAVCMNDMKMSAANTNFRVYTNRGNVQRKVLAMGASVVSALFNVFAGLNIAALPITLTSMGTQNVNIPALVGDINMGESGGNWSVGSTTPRPVPLEFDFRLAGSYGTATGRRVLFNMANFAYDEERVRLGVAATPDYGDPNRVGAQHVGQFYILGEQLLILGARAGSAGLIPFQLKMVPDIDDGNFTVFQRMNTQAKTFANVEPWGSGGLTQVVSSYVLGLPSTTVDAEVDWANATPGLVGISLRGFLDSWSASGAASMPSTISGSSANASMINGTLQSVQNTTRGLASWLPLAEVTDPTHQGYLVPPQTDSRGWAINRNGQIMRGTATITNVIHKMAAGNAIGARYFTMRNPAVTTAATRYADLYFLSIVEPQVTHIVNSYMDPVRGYPDNNLWRLFGPVNSQGTLTVTLPFIMPRRAQISGANGIVPDPFEAGNLTNVKLEWDLAESTYDTTPTGINGPYFYQNIDMRWWYEKTAYTSDEKHQFWWQ